MKEKRTKSEMTRRKGKGRKWKNDGRREERKKNEVIEMRRGMKAKTKPSVGRDRILNKITCGR